MESFSKKQQLIQMNSVSENEILSVEILSVECQEFLNSLDEKHLKSYYIAKSHLGSSFDLEKSNSFLHWKKNRQIST